MSVLDLLEILVPTLGKLFHIKSQVVGMENP